MVKKVCMFCNKEFYVYPHRSHIAKYCSKKCMNYSKVGHIPWNKNTKGIMRPNKTSFKKGLIPWNQNKSMPKGKYAANWRGGKKKCGKYILIYCPNHPFANEQGYVFEHRLVMEKKIGRYLRPEERVHHINGNPSDNRSENIMLFDSNSSHSKHHCKIRKTHKSNS